MKKARGLKIKHLLERYAARQIIEKKSSDVNATLEVVQVGEKTMLNSAHTNYSYGGLHRVFQKAFKALDLKERNVGRTLILGFGAGSVAAIIREELGIHCKITAVENDAEVIRLGAKYFNTARFQDLEIIERDAADFIKHESSLFDLIVVDVYIDFEVPESCQSMEFVRNISKCLAPGGMSVYNKLIYNHHAGHEAEELENKFRTLTGKTDVIKIRENIVNKLIVYYKSEV
ncbi:MAG: methyltransferase domain-containing protein [Bacteroidota bacterium]